MKPSPVMKESRENTSWLIMLLPSSKSPHFHGLWHSYLTSPANQSHSRKKQKQKQTSQVGIFPFFLKFKTNFKCSSQQEIL